jgi:hypothetical protein
VDPSHQLKYESRRLAVLAQELKERAEWLEACADQAPAVFTAPLSPADPQISPVLGVSPLGVVEDPVGLLDLHELLDGFQVPRELEGQSLGIVERCAFVKTRFVEPALRATRLLAEQAQALQEGWENGGCATPPEDELLALRLKVTWGELKAAAQVASLRSR